MKNNVQASILKVNGIFSNQEINILLVDDHPENLLALEAVLNSSNYNLIKATSGEEALRKVLYHDFALILLDVQMPGMNGFETAKLIKSREKSKDIPIIFITAISQAPEHVLYGYDVGAIDYIFKPFRPATLKAKVEGFVKIHQKNEQIKFQCEQLKEHSIEIHKAHQQLKILADELRIASEKRFRKIFDFSPTLISITSRKDGRYLDVNQSWLKYTGYGYEEVINQRINLYLFAENEDFQLPQDELINNARISYITKGGELREGLLSSEFIEINGECCILAMVLDITEMAVMEKEMRRLDRLYLIGEMAAGIAHEIRNPMTTVRGFLQMAKTKGGQLTNEHIDLMVGELNRANSIITEFLTLAKNKQTFQEEKDLNNIINNIYPLISAEAMVFDKRVICELADCPKLLLDEEEIRQLVLNLTLNGLEAMPPGGTLTIKTYTTPSGITLEVQDEGCGIKEENLDKLGLPFFTTKDHGTGLGLSVCFSVATRHNATIDVKTGPMGTTFYVEFKTA
ncbi:MAG: response regulator [Desulfitobacterium hafniense]|nr:response regulator [Desulfitobacterium hafniense]